jgi:hypothetical protein
MEMQSHIWYNVSEAKYTPMDLGGQGQDMQMECDEH